MYLREYEYILAIAREQNMSRAAESLYISQPALSRLLNAVENELGAPLFERRGHEMIPTPFGRRYIESARELVTLNARFEKKLRDFEGHISELSIMMPLIYTDFFLTMCVPRMQALYPSLFLRAINCSQKRLLGGLLQNEYPLALGIVTPENAGALAYKNIAVQEMVLAVPRDHPLTRMARRQAGYTFPYIPVEALEDVSFVMPDQGAHSGNFAERFLKAGGIRPRVSVRLSFTEPIYRFIAGSQKDVAILPSVPLRFLHLEDRVAYLSIRPSSEGDVLGLMYRKEHELSEQERSLVDIMRELYDMDDASVDEGTR